MQETGNGKINFSNLHCQNVDRGCEICNKLELEFFDAKKIVRQRLMIKYLNNELELNRYGSSLQTLYNTVKDQSKDLVNLNDPNGMGFFTFNFMPEVTLGSAIVFMKNIISKKWMTETEYIYCYEQRGMTIPTMGEGLHVHILFKKQKGKSPFHYKRECYSTFKKFTEIPEDILFAKHFLFVPISWKQDKIDYINGIKKKDPDGTKALKVRFDVIFREKNNLEKVYSNY